MAITQTGAAFKSLSFNNTSSRSYGVYLTGEAVYNAPQRAVELVSIPNRNGAFALDKGYFENIEVTYPAGIFGETEADFAQAISDFRNFLCSKKGYCRLTDEYNPNEYRMAVYKSGLEVSPAQLKAGEFDIVFECKPQRFLTSGETAVTVTSGGTINNPTYFDSSPLLKLYGYGNIQINSDTITASASSLTEVELGGSGGASVSLDMSMMNTGDTFYSSTGGYPQAAVAFTNNRTGNMSKHFYPYTLVSVTNGSANVPGGGVLIQPDLGTGFVKGTSKTVTTVAVADFGRLNQSTGNVETFRATITIATAYNGSNTITMSASVSTSGYDDNLTYASSYEQRGYSGISSKIILPSPAYIDLDNGEAYGTIDNQLVSVNSLVILPPELPVLKSGNNTITFDNTFTKLEVIPRWWKV